MGTIANPVSSNALSLLTGPSGPLSNQNSQISQAILTSASPTDVVALSEEALSLQMTDALFGGTSLDTQQTVDPALSLLSSIYGVTTPSSTSTGSAPALSSGSLINTIG